jgi:abequosyltransferase
MNFLLSICIPTYNRAGFLPATLQSILSQYQDDVQIVICDNGSCDQTDGVVKEFQKRYLHIEYFRFEKNVGPDRCFLKTVELASGKYCWLLGDDDILEPGALGLILDKIKAYPDLCGLTVHRNAYNATLQSRFQEPDLVGGRQDILFEDAKLCLERLFLLFGFLSAQIVKREEWLSVTHEEDVTPYFTAYVLIYVIGRMIQKRPRWLYVSTPCVGWRSGNDSFAKELGRYKRFELDVIGYHRIVTGLCEGCPRSLKTILNKVCKVHLFSHICDIKLNYPVENLVGMSWQACFPRFKNISSFWYKLLPVILTPRFLLIRLRRIYHIFKKPMQAL